MPTIKRHAIDTKRVRRSLELGAGTTETPLAGAKKDLIHTDSLRNVVRERAGELSVVEPESPEICRDLRLGAEAMAALFKGAMCKEARVDVRLGNEMASAPDRVSSDMHHTGNWTDGFFFAVICREYELLDVLCDVPLDLLRSSRTMAEECLYLMDHAAPELNNALKFALERHNAYFKKGKRPFDSDGYLALGPGLSRVRGGPGDRRRLPPAAVADSSPLTRRLP
jgi:hypothetical protein